MPLSSNWVEVGSFITSTSSVPDRTILVPWIFTSSTIIILCTPAQDYYHCGWINLRWDIPALGMFPRGKTEEVFKGENLFSFVDLPSNNFQLEVVCKFWTYGCVFQIWEMN